MNAIRYRLRSLAWVAWIAMCGLALGPSISRVLHAGVAPGPMAMHTGCAEMGSHSPVTMGARGGPSGHPGTPGHSSDSLDCCALCAVASSPLAVPTFFVPQLAGDPLSSTVPLERAAAWPGHRELWSAAVPRGPPPEA